MGLDGLHLSNVMGSHFCNRGMRRVFAVETLGLQTVNWTLWSELPRQAMKQQDRTRPAMYTEQWDLGALRLDRHKRGIFRFLDLVPK